MADPNTAPMVRGRVTDWQTGQGVDDATVTLFTIDDHRDLVFAEQVEGDESGGYAFPVPADGRYLVMASHLDYFANYGECEGGSCTSLDLRLLPHGFEGIGPPVIEFE